MSSGDKYFFNKLVQFKVQILWGIVLILSVYFCYFVINKADIPSHGFASYYTASKLLGEGEDVSRFYDNDWFSSKVQEELPEIYEIYHVNFPTTTILLLPLSAFNYSTARIIWTIFNIIILTITVGFLLKKFKFQGVWIPLILILVLLFQPLYANFSFGQAYVFIFSLLVLAWHAYKTDRIGLLGFAIGLIFILKSTSFIFFILLLIQKRWKSFLYALITVLIISLASLPWIGIDSWYTYSEKFVSYISHPSLSVTAYQTIHSFFNHLTTFNQQWNPESIFNLPKLGKILSTLSILTILVYSSIKVYKLKKTDLAFGLFVVAGLIVSPASLDYHYTIILFSIFVLLKWSLNNAAAFTWVVLIVSVLMIAAYIPYTSVKVKGGWLSLFAYPKLYGAIGLWSIFLFASGKHHAAKEQNISESNLLIEEKK